MTPATVVENLTRDGESWWNQSPDRRLLEWWPKRLHRHNQRVRSLPRGIEPQCCPHTHTHMTVSLFSNKLG